MKISKEERGVYMGEKLHRSFLDDGENVVFNIEGHIVEIDDTILNYYAIASVVEESIAGYLESIDKIINELNIGIDRLIDRTATMMQEVINPATAFAISCLVNKGVYDITESEFLSKYYYDYADYIGELEPIIERYSEIIGEERYYADLRRFQHENRSRWQGGGFGVTGAIKGAVTATAMNWTTDFFRSFGESKRRRQDETRTREAKNRLFHSSLTRNCYTNAINKVLYGLIDPIMHELYLHGIHDRTIISRERANALFDHIVKYVHDDEAATHELIKLVIEFPFERKFYEELYGYIYNDDLDTMEEYLVVYE